MSFRNGKPDGVVIADSLGRTPGRMRITIDPVNGNDGNTFVLGTDPDPAGAGRGSLPTWIATLKTLQGAFHRLPGLWQHPIFIDLPAGTINLAAAGLITGGQEAVLSGHQIDSEVRYLDPILFTYDAIPGVYLNGAKTVTLATGAVDIFSATTIGRAALAMTVDAHRGSIVEIVAGTGAGQWRRVARNTATTVHVVDAWATNPDATSTFRIWTPGTQLVGALIVDDVAYGASASVVVSPEIELVEDFAGQFLLIQTNAPCNFAGTMTGSGITNRIANVAQNSAFYPTWFDYWRDPGFKQSVGPYLKDGEILFYGSDSFIGGNAWGAVLDRVKVIVQDGTVGSWKIDADGNTGGADAAAGFMDVVKGASMILIKGSHAAAAVQNYNYGSMVSDRAGLDASACIFSSHATYGVLVDRAATANLRGVTGTGNGTYGAIVRGGSIAYVNRTTTTITGTTANARLGNAVGGSNQAWIDVPAGSGLPNANEVCALIDRAP